VPILSVSTCSAIGLIVARSDSSRLPGKALLPVAGRHLVGYVIERARRIRGLDSVVLATTDRPIDDVLARYATECGIAVFRGSANDVARRLCDCASEKGADYLVRMNGDSPFLDPSLVEEGLGRIADGFDLITSVTGSTFPYGVSVEIVRRETLCVALTDMSAEDREHVTRYFYRNASRYRICELTSDLPELSAARIVVDTPEDLAVFEHVVDALGSEALSAGYSQVAPLYIRMGHTR
jgi:spore coat polysaccharide biosynthesis protein SpsF